MAPSTGGEVLRRADDAATAIDQIVAHRLRRSDITSEAAKRLGEGADDDIRIARETRA